MYNRFAVMIKSGLISTPSLSVRTDVWLSQTNRDAKELKGLSMQPSDTTQASSKRAIPEFTLQERRGLKNVYWGLCWTYLSIWLLLLIAIFKGLLESNLLPQLDVEQCKFWSNVAIAARGGLWLSGGLLMLCAPAGLKIRKFACLCLLLDAGAMGVTAVGWFGYQLDVEFTGLRLVSFGLYVVFLRNLARALRDNQLTERCRKILNNLVLAAVCVGVAYVGVDYHPYFRYGAFSGLYCFFAALCQYFSMLGKMRAPLRNAYGFV
jgi:hypothetical protein